MFIAGFLSMMAVILLVTFLVWALKGSLRQSVGYAIFRRMRPTTDKVLQAQAQRARLRMNRLALQHPNSKIKTAVDDKTGASVYEIDIASWQYVRAIERIAYDGKVYHRIDGTTNACGWEPIDEALEESQATTQEYLVNLAKATETFTACKAEAGTGRGFLIRAPWGVTVTDELRSVEAKPPIEGLVSWDYTASRCGFTFLATYRDGSEYGVVKNGPDWTIECGPRDSLATAWDNSKTDLRDLEGR